MIEFIKPWIEVEVPAFVVGALFAYEDVLGAFSGLIAVEPPHNETTFNSIALTSDRLIAFDVHDATGEFFSLPIGALTGVSTPADATEGRVSCTTNDGAIHMAELPPTAATFIQEIVYNAAAGRLYRVRPSEQAETF